MQCYDFWNDCGSLKSRVKQIWYMCSLPSQYWLSDFFLAVIWLDFLSLAVFLSNLLPLSSLF